MEVRIEKHVLYYCFYLIGNTSQVAYWTRIETQPRAEEYGIDLGKNFNCRVLAEDGRVLWEPEEKLAVHVVNQGTGWFYNIQDDNTPVNWLGTCGNFLVRLDAENAAIEAGHKLRIPVYDETGKCIFDPKYLDDRCPKCGGEMMSVSDKVPFIECENCSHRESI